jgi:hypothetical protein
MKKLIALLLLAPMIGFGIEPVIFTLDETNPTYTVPSDKVLLIERVFLYEWESIYVGVQTGGTTNLLVFPMLDEVFRTFQPPLKIPSSSVLFRGVSNEGITNSALTFMGMVAETSDLYVYIDNEVSDMLVQGGVFSFDVHASTPRPARVSVEGSMDLLTPWQPIDATVEKKSANSYTVSIPVEDEEKYFAKYHLRGVDP